MSSDAGPARQGAIFMAGYSGREPTVPTAYPQLEARAQKAMSREAWRYVRGGAGMHRTMEANLSGFERWRIVPRMLAGASPRDLTVSLFGRTLPAPVLLAPIGVQDLVHPDADAASARAAARTGLPMILSNQASVAMEACAEVMGEAPRWFQLYWGRSDELVESLVHRAEACGCEALVITLDTTTLGWRPWDLDIGHLPFLHGRGIAQYTSDPVFRAMLSEPPEANPEAAALLFTQIFSDPTLTWERIRTVRRRTRMPIVLKGILHPDDARRALDEGADGLIVSNHGGRQVDGAIGAIEALPGVVAAVDGRVPVLMDSGIRSGAHMFKALALGARAVCVGRPVMYGLALDGADGAEAVLRNLVAEFDLTMGLAGCRTLAEITPDRLVPAPPP
jgi:lactate 2-monooxygenase